RVMAAKTTGARVIVSVLSREEAIRGRGMSQMNGFKGEVEFFVESDDALASHIAAMPAHFTERIRFAAPDHVPQIVREAASRAGVYLADEPVQAEGRVELLWYLREQSVSYDYHRYGNLGARAADPRKEPE